MDRTTTLEWIPSVVADETAMLRALAKTLTGSGSHGHGSTVPKIILSTDRTLSIEETRRLTCPRVCWSGSSETISSLYYDVIEAIPMGYLDGVSKSGLPTPAPE